MTCRLVVEHSAPLRFDRAFWAACRSTVAAKAQPTFDPVAVKYHQFYPLEWAAPERGFYVASDGWP